MNFLRLILALLCLPLIGADLNRAAIAQKHRELADLFDPSPSAPAPHRALVAWTPADYAPSSYQSFAVGLTRGGFLLTEDCTDLQFHVTGRQKPSGIGSPGQVAELTGSPFETVINFEILTPDRSARLAGPFQVRWDGKRLLHAVAAKHDSTPIAGPFTKGTLLEFQAVTSRIASAGQTIAGEPGQIVATVPDWPRTEGVGGGLDTYGIYGTRFTASTSTSLAAWVAALDAGNFIPPADASGSLNQGGFCPIAVTGLVSGSRVGLLDIQDSIARSNDAANRTRRDSGTGYLRAATQGTVGGFQWSVSGQKLADVIAPANVAQRSLFTQYAGKAFIGLISNDLKDGPVAEAESRFRTAVAQLNAEGITDISAGNCLYRWVTSDGWRTFAGQTEQLPGFNAKAAEWDARLAAMLAEGLIQEIVDRRTAVQDPSQGYKWRLPVVVASFNAQDGSTQGAVKAGSQGWLADLFTNRHTVIAGNILQLFGNSSSQLNVNAGAGASTPVPTGTPIEVLDFATLDGVHPAPFGNYLLAQGLAPFNP